MRNWFEIEIFSQEKRFNKKIKNKFWGPRIQKPKKEKSNLNLNILNLGRV